MTRAVRGQVPWSSRAEAAALLGELSSPERRFDAVVVGEYERAFSGDDFAAVTALFERAGVQMWLPEAGGRWEREDPVAQALVMVLGAQSQREVLRSRHRVLVNGRAAYRCRHGHSSSQPRAADGPRYVYVREDLLVRELVGQLANRPAGSEGDAVRPNDTASTVDKLRRSGLLIVHDGRAWSLRTGS